MLQKASAAGAHRVGGSISERGDGYGHAVEYRVGRYRIHLLGIGDVVCADAGDGGGDRQFDAGIIRSEAWTSMCTDPAAEVTETVAPSSIPRARRSSGCARSWCRGLPLVSRVALCIQELLLRR